MNNKELKLIRQLLFFSVVEAANDISKTSSRTWQRYEKKEITTPDDVIFKILNYVDVYNKMLVDYDNKISRQLQNKQVAQINYDAVDSKEDLSSIAKKNLHKSVCAAMKAKYLDKLELQKEEIMNIQDMRKITEERKNLIGFLHFSEILELNDIFNETYEVNDKNFYEICNKTIDLYSEKLLTNKEASEIFKILNSANKNFKTEAYRFDHSDKSLYKYNEAANAYEFQKKTTFKEFNSLNYYLD